MDVVVVIYESALYNTGAMLHHECKGLLNEKNDIFLNIIICNGFWYCGCLR
jgi:hypothetical protein